MAVINIQNLRYSYPGCTAPALDEVSIKIEEGQMVGVIGANGAGKSTLCLALAGLIPALYHGKFEGTVTVCGMNTSQYSSGQYAGKVGLVLQNPSTQISGMRYSVFTEVAFGLENLGISRNEILIRVGRVLDLVGLSPLAERSPYSLSSGQQQRLALASILVMNPKVLVLDEPTSMLDHQGSRSVFEIIQNLIQMGTTVVIAEHNLEWISEYAGRVIVLREGRVVFDGNPTEVLSSPIIVEAGLNWLHYTKVAQMAKGLGMWPGSLPLPVTLEQAVRGFTQTGGCDANPG